MVFGAVVAGAQGYIIAIVVVAVVEEVEVSEGKVRVEVVSSTTSSSSS